MKFRQRETTHVTRTARLDICLLSHSLCYEKSQQPLSMNRLKQLRYSYHRKPIPFDARSLTWLQDAFFHCLCSSRFKVPMQRLRAVSEFVSEFSFACVLSPGGCCCMSGCVSEANGVLSHDVVLHWGLLFRRLTSLVLQAERDGQRGEVRSSITAVGKPGATIA